MLKLILKLKFNILSVSKIPLKTSGTAEAAPVWIAVAFKKKKTKLKKNRKLIFAFKQRQR